MEFLEFLVELMEGGKALATEDHQRAGKADAVGDVQKVLSQRWKGGKKNHQWSVVQKAISSLPVLPNPPIPYRASPVPRDTPSHTPRPHMEVTLLPPKHATIAQGISSITIANSNYTTSLPTIY